MKDWGESGSTPISGGTLRLKNNNPSCPESQDTKSGRVSAFDPTEGVSAKRILQFFLIGCFLCLISDIPSGSGVPYLVAKGFLYAILFSTVLLPLRYGLTFLVLIAVTGQDIIQSNSEVADTGQFVMASIWQGRLGPLRPSWVVFAYCLALYLKYPVRVRDRLVVVAALWFATVPVLTSYLYGAFETNHASKHIITDLKLPVLLISSILLYSGYFRRYPNQIRDFVAAFVGSVLARHFVAFAYWFNDIGSVHAGVNRASIDSTKFTLALVFIIAVYLVLVRKRFMVGGLLGSATGMLMAIYTTRMLWLTTVLGTMITLLSMRLNRWALAIPVVGILGLCSVFVLQQLAPENAELASNKGNRFSSGLTHSNFLEQLDPARYAEIINVLDTSVNRMAMFWGSGYGAYYTESARPFPPRMEDAFPQYMFDDGQFFNCHNYVVLMYFKHGLLGLILISSLWLIPGLKCFLILRKHPPTYFSILYSSLVAFIPTTIFTLYWSGKGDILSGFCIAFYMVFSEQYATRKTNGSA